MKRVFIGPTSSDVVRAGLESLLTTSPALSVVGGAQRMTLFAHAGHWAAQLLYLAPVLAMVGALLWARIRGKSGIDDEDDV